MDAITHPIALEQVFFTRTVVIAIPEHDAYEDKATDLALPENKINLHEIEGDAGAYQVIMRTQMNSKEDPAYPYVIDMECIAFLRADPAMPTEEAKRGVIITAHSVLYGAIREAVSWITGRHPYGPLMLGLSVLQPKKPDPEKSDEI